MTSPEIPAESLSIVCDPGVACLHEWVGIQVCIAGVADGAWPERIPYWCFDSDETGVASGIARRGPDAQPGIYRDILMVGRHFQDGLCRLRAEWNELRAEATFCVVKRDSVLLGAVDAVQQRIEGQAAIEAGDEEKAIQHFESAAQIYGRLHVRSSELAVLTDLHELYHSVGARGRARDVESRIEALAPVVSKVRRSAWTPKLRRIVNEAREAVRLPDLLKMGLHFGHPTAKWNPKMKPYIFGERDGLHIIDVGKTASLLQRAEDYARELASTDKTILFVGTAPGVRDIVASEAQGCRMPYVAVRWPRGLLTNFRVVGQKLVRLSEIEGRLGEPGLSSSDHVRLEKELMSLRRHFDGLRQMVRLPDALFVFDIATNAAAVVEANQCGISVIGAGSTNCDPTSVDLFVPANERATRATQYVVGGISNAIIQGRESAASSKPLPALDARMGTAEFNRLQRLRVQRKRTQETLVGAMVGAS